MSRPWLQYYERHDRSTASVPLQRLRGRHDFAIAPEAKLIRLHLPREYELVRAKLFSKERFGLKRQRRRRWYVAWACAPAMHRPGWRAGAASFVLLLLLVPYISGLILFAGRETTSCGMQCCKRSKLCCCRKSGASAHHDGPSWIASSNCPPGCRQSIAGPGTAVAGLVSSRIEFSPAIPGLRVRMSCVSAWGSSDIAYALFGRPPPRIPPQS